MMGEYIRNNKYRRCIKCKGREIFYEGPTKDEELSNLIQTKFGFECLNKDECLQNQYAESTSMHLTFEGDKLVDKKVFYNGEAIIQVTNSEKEGR